MKSLQSAAALLLLSVSVAHATAPTSKTFDVTGNITQKGCQLQATQDVVITAVSFDKLEDAATVKANGIGPNGKFFSLEATQCTAGQVSATIIGTGDSDPTLLAIDSGTDSAKNIAIAFGAESETTDGKLLFLPLNTGQTTPAVGNDQYATDHTFYLSAEVVKTSATAQPGLVAATAQVHINYL